MSYNSTWNDNITCVPSTAVRVILTIILLIVMCISISGNVLICGIVYRRAAMRSGINLLLASIALSDFFAAVVNFCLSVIVLNLGSWPFGDVVCTLNGLSFNLIHTEKMIILMVISIDRYFIIVKRKDTMTPIKARIFICISWFVAVVLSLPPLFGWGHFIFRNGYVQCLLDFNERHRYNPSYTIFISTAVVFVPAITLAILYHRILRTVRRNCFRVQNHPPVTPTAMHRKGKLFIDYSYKTKTSTTILFLSLVFVMSVLPLGIVNVYLAIHGFTSNLNTCGYLALLWISYSHAVFNPFIYYTRIKKFRESVHDLWPQFCVWPHLMPIRPRRRIRPHVMYQVEMKDKIYFVNNSRPSSSS